jgi:hypothetical protein
LRTRFARLIRFQLPQLFFNLQIQSPHFTLYSRPNVFAYLASNENPFGCSQAAKDALHQEIEQLALYPDGYSAFYWFARLIRFQLPQLFFNLQIQSPHFTLYSRPNADGVVVGSALVKKVEELKTKLVNPGTRADALLECSLICKSSHLILHCTVVRTSLRILQIQEAHQLLFPGKPIEEVKMEYGLEKVVKLASNENPFGCSQAAKDPFSLLLLVCPADTVSAAAAVL